MKKILFLFAAISFFLSVGQPCFGGSAFLSQKENLSNYLIPSDVTISVKTQKPVALSKIFDHDFLLEESRIAGDLELANQYTKELETIKTVITEQLKTIQQMIESGVIHPGKTETAEPVGIFPLTGDPPSWGHIAVILQSIIDLKLNRVILISMGDARHKKGVSAEAVRYPMIQKVAEKLAPLVTFSKIGSRSRISSEENALKIIQQFPDAKQKFYYISGDEYLGTLPLVFSGLVSQYPIDKNRFTLAFISRTQSLESLKEKVTFEDSFFPIQLGDNILENISSSRFKREPEASLLPHFIRQHIWKQGLFGQKKTLEFDKLLKPMSYFLENNPAAAQDFLDAISFYFARYKGINRNYLENALDVLAETYGVEKPEVIHETENRLTLLFPYYGAQAEFYISGEKLSAANLKYIYKLELTLAEEENLLARKLEIPPLAHSDQYRNKKVLITGAAGYVCQELIQRLMECKVGSLILVDNDQAGLERLKQNYETAGIQMEIHAVDISNTSQLEQAFQNKPEFVFHLAAFKFSDLAELPLMRQQVYESNVRGTQNLLRLSRQHGVTNFVFVSTNKAAQENANFYGRTKQQGEDSVKSFRGEKMKRLILRFPNILGSTGSLLPAVDRQLQKNKKVLFQMDARRYFLSRREVVPLILNAVFEVGDENIIVLKPKQEYSIKEIISRLGALRNKTVEFVNTGRRPGDKQVERLLTDAESAVASEYEKYWTIPFAYDNQKTTILLFQAA